MWKRILMCCAVLVISCFPLIAPGTLVAACGVDPPLPAEGFSWPASGPVSTPWSLDCRTDRGHRGIDITVPAGDAIRASASGVVIFAGYTPAEGGGTTISVEHQGGLRTTYLHLAQIKVSQGQQVAQGQELGSSDGSPLHFGMKTASGREVYFNPADYLAAPGLPLSQMDPTSESGAATETVPAYPIAMPLSPGVQSSADSASAVPLSDELQSTVAASGIAHESRPVETNGYAISATHGSERISANRVPAFPSDRLSATGHVRPENMIQESSGTGTIRLTLTGALAPFSDGAISIYKKSSASEPAKKNFARISGDLSPVRNLLLVALLLLVTVGSGCMGRAASLRPAPTGRYASCLSSR